MEDEAIVRDDVKRSRFGSSSESEPSWIPDALDSASSRIRTLEHKLTYKDWSLQQELLQVRENCARALIASLQNKLQALDERVNALDYYKKYRSTRISLLKMECDMLLQAQEPESVSQPVIAKAEVPEPKVEPSKVEKAVSKSTPPSAKRKSIKPVKEETKPPRLSTASNAGLKKLATPVRVSTNNRDRDLESDEPTPVSRPRRSTAMTPPNSSTSKSAPKSKFSSAKSMKSKPRFSNKSSQVVSNPFAAFDLTSRVAAPKLKTN